MALQFGSCEVGGRLTSGVCCIRRPLALVGVRVSLMVAAVCCRRGTLQRRRPGAGRHKYTVVTGHGHPAEVTCHPALGPPSRAPSPATVTPLSHWPRLCPPSTPTSNPPLPPPAIPDRQPPTRRHPPSPDRRLV